MKKNFTSANDLFNSSVSTPIRVGVNVFMTLSISEQQSELANLEAIVYPYLSDMGKRGYNNLSRGEKYARLVNRVHTLRNLHNRSLGSSYVGAVLSAPKSKDALIRFGVTDFSKLPLDDQQLELDRMKKLVYTELSPKTKRDFPAYSIQEQYETLVNKVHTMTHKNNVAATTKTKEPSIPQRKLKSFSDYIIERKEIFKAYPTIYDTACAVIDNIASSISGNLSSTEKAAILKKIDDFKISITQNLRA